MKPVLERAKKKTAELSDPKKRFLLLAAFVGIPLPGTGAWTGAMGAFLVGMPFAEAMASIFVGVVCSGVIMTSVSVAGKKGAFFAGALLIGGLLSQMFTGSKSEKPE